jgi:plasmid stabilization system protein ParE
VTLALRIRSEAQQDLQEAARWYEAQRQGLGQEFLNEVVSCLHRIAEQPEMFPTMHRETRRALIRKFPFGIFYRLESQVVVLAVMHASRDPRRWQSRGKP